MTAAKWTKNGDVVPQQYVVGNNLVIEYATETNSGTYFCQGTDELYGINFEAKSELFVGRKYFCDILY